MDTLALGVCQNFASTAPKCLPSISRESVIKADPNETIR